MSAVHHPCGYRPAALRPAPAGSPVEGRECRTAGFAPRSRRDGGVDHGVAAVRAAVRYEGLPRRRPAGARTRVRDDPRRLRAVRVRATAERLAFERLETLHTGKYGDEGDKLIFKILRRGEHEATGEADLALRYDMTVPLARVVAAYGSQLPVPYKRYVMGPVLARRPARSRPLSRVRAVRRGRGGLGVTRSPTPKWSAPSRTR